MKRYTLVMICTDGLHRHISDRYTSYCQAEMDATARLRQMPEAYTDYEVHETPQTA